MVRSASSRVSNHETETFLILRDVAKGPLLRIREGVKLMSEKVVTPRPASTILLLRDATGTDEIEVFMMVRHYEIDFNSGALVFPGGSVDENDKEIIARPELYSGGEGCDADALSFRIAAIRETFEESGILLARPRGSTTLIDGKRASEIEAAHRSRSEEHTS